MPDFLHQVHNYKDSKQISVLELSGDLDTETVPELEKIIKDLLKSKQCRIVVDMKNIKYINSSGIGLIVNSIKLSRKEKGDIKLASINPKVLYPLNLVGFTNVFPVFDTIEEAAGSFKLD